MVEPVFQATVGGPRADDQDPTADMGVGHLVENRAHTRCRLVIAFPLRERHRDVMGLRMAEISM